ncbi:hypothetical protein Trydic_g19087 [Trypoxylus dichotomus]
MHVFSTEQTDIGEVKRRSSGRLFKVPGRLNRYIMDFKLLSAALSLDMRRGVNKLYDAYGFVLVSPSASNRIHHAPGSITRLQAPLRDLHIGYSFRKEFIHDDPKYGRHLWTQAGEIINKIEDLVLIDRKSWNFSKFYTPGSLVEESLADLSQAEGFFCGGITGYANLVHHCDNLTKEEFTHWIHKSSPPPTKAKRQFSADKTMAAVFWNADEIS